MKDRIDDAERRMDSAVKALSSELGTVRTGRASPSILDRIEVEAYEQMTPLNQLAQINVPDAQQITIQPYDPTLMKAVEKAIQESDIGLSPNNDGELIRLPVPQPTEERRKELVKVLGGMAEDGRIAVRNVRKDINNELKRLEKDGEISKNDLSNGQNDVQKLTDAHVAKVDEMVKAKEAEIMEL